jgi:hypothetical protein
MRPEAHKFSNTCPCLWSRISGFLVFRYGRRITSAGSGSVTSGNYGSDQQKFGAM